MSNLYQKNTTFLTAVTICLALPVLFSSQNVKGPPYAPEPIPNHIGSLSGTDWPLNEQARKNYTPSDVTLSCRRYQKTDTPPIDCVVQQSNVFENLHNLFACFLLTDPHANRLATLKIEGPTPAEATIFESCVDNRRHLTLFCFQSQLGSATYPPQSICAQTKLLLMRKSPCRLLEATTEAAPDSASAIKRLKEFAKIACAQPI